jgi:hypothetical protein
MVADISGILLAGLNALAEAGEGEQACRLAGRACAVLRQAHRREWRRFNALLHRLARDTGPVGRRSCFDPATDGEGRWPSPAPDV